MFYHCNNIDCNKRVKKKKTCSLCKITKYCDVECQKIDWKRHKEECKNLQQIDNIKKTQNDITNDIILKGYFDKYNIICKNHYNLTKQKGFVLLKWNNKLIESTYLIPQNEINPLIGLTGITELMKKGYIEFNPSTHFIFIIEAELENKKDKLAWISVIPFK
jgi:hypothetical protein